VVATTVATVAMMKLLMAPSARAEFWKTDEYQWSVEE
jgi:hypothetical protein